MKRMFLLLWLLGFVATQATSKPNIVIILADDLGWNDVGFHGSNLMPTPNIDALAYSGIILNEYYVTPLCSPTRAALMTARHPIHTGMWDRVMNASQPYGLGLEEKLLPHYMKDHGYATHIVGKWHLGYFKTEYTPLMRGWDSHFGHYNSRLDYWNYVHGSGSEEEFWLGRDLYDNKKPAAQAAGEYLTRLYTRKAIEIVEQHDTSKPLLLYFAQVAVHVGNFYDYLQAPKETIDKMNIGLTGMRRMHAAMVSELDDSVGAIVTALSDKGILDNTIIVFSTDNGGASMYFPVAPSSNWPFRGGKVTTWEGGVKGVAAVWSPLLSNSARVSKQLMHVQDWIPTLLGAFNEQPEGAPYALDGVNAWPALNDPHKMARNEVLHMIDPSSNFSALRQDKWKITLGSPSFGLFDYEWSKHDERLSAEYDLASVQRSSVAKAFSKTLRPLPPKDVILRLRTEATVNDCQKVDGPPCNPVGSKPCLFDLEKDYCENNDVAAENPDVVARLLKAIDRHSKTVVPNRARPADTRANPALYGGFWVPWLDDIEV